MKAPQRAAFVHGCDGVRRALFKQVYLKLCAEQCGSIRAAPKEVGLWQ